MKKLLMLGSNLVSKQLILEAQSRGYHTIVTDYLEPARSRCKSVADEYWMISTGDPDALEQECRAQGIDGVIHGISPFNISATMELTKRLNLPCYCTPESWHYTMDKRDFKDVCIRNHVPVARDYHVSNPPTEEELNAIQYPVVVKAINQSGNYGMSYCYGPEDMPDACAYARKCSKCDTLIVEKMLRGSEYAAYYVLAEGKASLLNLSKMYHPKDRPSNCYSLTTTYADGLDQFLKEFDPFARNALAEMGCKEGIAWIELMRDDDGRFYALEMGYRLSGDMMALVHNNLLHFNSYGWLLDIAMGIPHTEQDLPVSQTKLPDRIGCSYILWSKDSGIIKKIIGLDKLSFEGNNFQIEETCVLDHFVIRNQFLVVFTFDVASYEEMCSIMRKINETVEIWNENENIAIYFEDFEDLKIEP